MSALSDGGAGNYLTSGTPPVTAYPFSVSMWVKLSRITNWEYFFELFDDTDSSAVNVFYRGDVDDTIRVGSMTAAAASSNATGETITDTTTWHQITAVWASASSREITLDGDFSNRGTNATSRTISVLDDLRLFAPEAGGTRFAGNLAEVCVWDVALSQSNIESLFDSAETGIFPDQVAAGNVIAYWTLNTTDTLNDQAGSNNLTNNDGDITFVADQPTMINLPTITSRPSVTFIGLG